MPTLDFSKLIATPMWTGSRDDTNGGTFNSTNYVYNTSGTVIGLRFSAPSTSLEKVHFYLESGNATVKAGPLVEIRNWDSGDPGSTLLNSQTVTFTGAQKWHTATFSPVVTLTVGTHYWVVIGGENTDDFDFITDVSDDDSFLLGILSVQTDTAGWSGATRSASTTGTRTTSTAGCRTTTLGLGRVPRAVGSGSSTTTGIRSGSVTACTGSPIPRIIDTCMATRRTVGTRGSTRRPAIS